MLCAGAPLLGLIDYAAINKSLLPVQNQVKDRHTNYFVSNALPLGSCSFEAHPRTMQRIILLLYTLKPDNPNKIFLGRKRLSWNASLLVLEAQ